MALSIYQNPARMYNLRLIAPTGLLNISLLACAAMPPLIFGAFERRAGTPLTLSLSAKVAV